MSELKVNRRPRMSQAGSFVLAIVFAGALFGVATVDLLVPSFRPAVGKKAPITYRVARVGIVEELDKKSQYRIERYEVRAGKVVTIRDMNRLAALETGRRPPGLPFSLGFFLLLVGFFLIASHSLRVLVPQGGLVRVQIVMFTSLILVLAACKVLFMFTSASVFWVPLAGLSIGWGIVLSRRAAIAIGAFGAFAAASLYPMDWGVLVTLGAQAIVPALLLDPVRKRRSPGLGWLGGLGAAVLAYVGFAFLSQGRLPPGELASGSSGLLAVIGAAAISPLLAYGLKPLLLPSLGLLSRSRLNTLGDFDHPLLKAVQHDAPGTWQHSMAMANMAEMACNAIGADAALVRVGAYFHDIGKTINPPCFAENLQGGERSPHLDMAPEESAAVIIEHVTHGLELAREHKLPFAIREFIYTHHGDGVLEFFWHKCQEQGNPRNLPKRDFQYVGIPPQTKETGILAIVDAVEAASRTLKGPDEKSIDGLVMRIVFGKLTAGQLSEAPLSAGELATITKTIQEFLRGQFHVRPEYPWQKAEREKQAAAAAAQARVTSDPPIAAQPAATPAAASAMATATAHPDEAATDEGSAATESTPSPEPEAVASSSQEPVALQARGGPESEALGSAEPVPPSSEPELPDDTLKEPAVARETPAPT